MSEQLTIEDVITFLLETSMFGGLDPVELSQILRIMQVMRVRDGKVLFREGDNGDGWFVAYEGEFLVTKRQEFGPARQIAILGPRSCFGEMAVLDGSHRSATVTAVGEGIVFKFPRDAFLGLLEDNIIAAYKLVLEMARVLSGRQRKLNRQLVDLMDTRSLQGSGIREHIGSLVDDQLLSQ